jgi:hypothetical protein
MLIFKKISHPVGDALCYESAILTNFENGVTFENFAFVNVLFLLKIIVSLLRLRFAMAAEAQRRCHHFVEHLAGGHRSKQLRSPSARCHCWLSGSP